MDVDVIFKIRREKSPMNYFLLTSPKISFQIRGLLRPLRLLKIKKGFFESAK